MGKRVILSVTHRYSEADCLDSGGRTIAIIDHCPLKALYFIKGIPSRIKKMIFVVL